MVFTGGLQEPYKAQLCCSSGLWCDVQGGSEIAEPDGDTPNQHQNGAVDALVCAWLAGFLHRLPPSVLLWGCHPLSAGCVVQSEGGEADVRCEGNGADTSLAGCSSLLLKVHALGALPKEPRLCTWLVEFLR